ncbi:MAG: winged helix-turn-helix transcriptional regulator [Nanoarchaeota archaeon]|nr:winged helix-turn-helix transcriptional regulator [Nanoarchaeota archaeon]
MKLLNNSQIKIIEEIFKNPGINLTGIIEKTRLSPNYVSNYANLLSSKNIIKEERLEKKRVYLRRFYLNFNSNLAKNLFMLVKDERKEMLFKKYPQLRQSLEHVCSEIREMDFFLIYGSYARLAAEKESDLDILVVGNIKNNERIREMMVSLDMEISIKIETLGNFKKRINDALHRQIIKENVLICDSGKFIEVLFKK